MMTLQCSICGIRYHFTFKFLVLTCFFIFLFCSLGIWQYHRAQQKRILIQAYAKRPHLTPIPFSKLFNRQDYRFYAIHLKGHFDNQHQIFLDNRTYQGQVGYEVYTPFFVTTHHTAILIDRGWVPANVDRSHLPQLPSISENISLQGVLNFPPAFFTLGDMVDTREKHFPLRIQYVDLNELSKILGYPLAPYIVWLDPANPQGFKREWKVSFIGPEKHIMYSIQWFAFAISLLILFIVLNLHRAN